MEKRKKISAMEYVKKINIEIKKHDLYEYKVFTNSYLINSPNTARQHPTRCNEYCNVVNLHLKRPDILRKKGGVHNRITVL